MSSDAGGITWDQLKESLLAPTIPLSSGMWISWATERRHLRLSATVNCQTALALPCRLRRTASLNKKYFSTNFPSREVSEPPQTWHVISRSAVSGPASTSTIS
jgi:hypothetical protein